MDFQNRGGHFCFSKIQLALRHFSWQRRSVICSWLISPQFIIFISLAQFQKTQKFQNGSKKLKRAFSVKIFHTFRTILLKVECGTFCPALTPSYLFLIDALLPVPPPPTVQPSPRTNRGKCTNANCVWLKCHSFFPLGTFQITIRRQSFEDCMSVTKYHLASFGVLATKVSN